MGWCGGRWGRRRVLAKAARAHWRKCGDRHGLPSGRRQFCHVKNILLSFLTLVASSEPVAPTWAITGPSVATATSPLGYTLSQTDPNSLLLGGAVLLAMGAAMWFGGHRVSERDPTIGGTIEGLFLAIGGTFVGAVGGAMLAVGGIWWLIERWGPQTGGRAARRRRRKARRSPGD